jgi:hypothetical protein
VIDKDETLLKVTDLQRLVECVIILFSPINFVREHEVRHGREIFTLLEARASKIAGEFREFCLSVSA